MLPAVTRNKGQLETCHQLTFVIILFQEVLRVLRRRGRIVVRGWTNGWADGHVLAHQERQTLLQTSHHNNTGTLAHTTLSKGSLVASVEGNIGQTEDRTHCTDPLWSARLDHSAALIGRECLVGAA